MSKTKKQKTLQVDYSNDKSEEDITNPVLEETVDPQSSNLKELIVNYVGDKLAPEDGNVTVEMTLQVFAEEFKEFVLPLAEENWIRGYEQAFLDMEDGTGHRAKNPAAQKEG